MLPLHSYELLGILNTRLNLGSLSSTVVYAIQEGLDCSVIYVIDISSGKLINLFYLLEMFLGLETLLGNADSILIERSLRQHL